MKQFVDIIRHREYHGFVLGCLSMIAAYELQNNLTLLVFLMLLMLFVGWPLIKKYGN